MKCENKDVVIVGGGPAGLAAAVKLHQLGVRDILVVEREKQPGGILRQCIHDGFGLTRFGETLSGPEYAQRFLSQAQQLGIEIVPDTTVLQVSGDRLVTTASRDGLAQYKAGAVVLAMGCRERTRGALAIPGERPTGVFTAGVAQAYMNLYNTMVGKRVVILGSGDIGLIMARRMTLEGAQVLGVYEIQPYANGLPRNIEQCLNDYHIPLHLSHTVTEIHGNARLTGVTVSAVDERCRPIPGTEECIDCDTLILSVGLLPENELSLDAGVLLDPRTRGAVVDQYLQTSVPGIFAAGNVLHVHDVVDFVSLEAEHLAEGVARYLAEGGLPRCESCVRAGAGVGHVLPHTVSGAEDVTLSLRVRTPMKNCVLEVRQDGRTVKKMKMRKALPAEMIQVPLKAEDLQEGADLEVSVQC